MSVKARSVRYDIEFASGEYNHKQNLKSKRIKTRLKIKNINKKMLASVTNERHKNPLAFTVTDNSAVLDMKIYELRIIAFFRQKQNQNNNS